MTSVFIQPQQFCSEPGSGVGYKSDKIAPQVLQEESMEPVRSPAAHAYPGRYRKASLPHSPTSKDSECELRDQAW